LIQNKISLKINKKSFFLSIMKNIKNNFKFLCCLTAPGDMCQSMVRTADKNLFCAICECVQNVMNGNVQIIKKMLNKRKEVLRKLQKKGTLKSKKKLLLQKGGSVFAYIILAALSVLTEL
jgi:hypothetical protein